MNDDLFAYYGRALPAIRHAVTASGLDAVSDPFFVSIPEGYKSQPVRLMVVGQETHGWGDGTTADVATLLDRHRRFDLARGHSARRSPFWRAAHSINERLGNDGDFVWANLIPLDQGKWRPLPALRDRVREAAPAPGVLGKLIEVTEPGAVVFFVGPTGYYQYELGRQFQGVERRGVDGFTHRELIHLHHHALPEATFCTYHPAYLQRSKRWGIVDRVADLMLEAQSETGSG